MALREDSENWQEKTDRLMQTENYKVEGLYKPETGLPGDYGDYRNHTFIGPKNYIQPSDYHTHMGSETPKKKSDVNVLCDILDECKSLLEKKSSDYNQSRIKLTHYFPRGLESIIDIMNMKVLRIYSVLEKEGDVNFESVEDSAKDLINYASMFIAYSRNKLEK